MRRAVLLLLLGAALLAGPPAAAFDIGPILEARRLQGFTPATPEETILAAGIPAPGAPTPVVSRVGRRWGYLALYATPTQPVARAGPFPFGRCGEQRPDIALAPFGEAAWRVTFRGCPDGVDAEWLLMPGGDVLSFAPARPAALTRWSGATATEALAADIARRRGDATPLTVNAAPSPGDVAAAHQAALAAWRRGRAPEARRAQSALHALGPAIDRVDWFGPALNASIANDVGFWLQQTGGCAEAGDALPLFAAALRAEPGRIPTRLNRADALAQRGRCAPDPSAARAAAEEYRLYCTAQRPARIPAAIARRIATALEVSRLDEEACRPRLGAHRAIAAGDAAALAALLTDHPEDAAEADPTGAFPLAAAIARQDTGMAEALLRAGADPDRTGTSEYAYAPLVPAAWNGDVAMVRLLLAHHAKAEPYRPRVIPLHAAAQAARQHGGAVSVALLTLLFDARASPDAADEQGRTTLMEAAGAAAPPEVIALLLARGALVNRTTRDGRNAAHAVPPFSPAAFATLEALIAAGVNLDQQESQGMTPLNHLFAWSGRQPEIVRGMAERMITAGADPRLPDVQRRSALFRAALSGDAALVALMVAAPMRGAAPAQEDPRMLLRRRLAEAAARPAPPGCPCEADWQRILDLLGPP